MLKSGWLALNQFSGLSTKLATGLIVAFSVYLRVVLFAESAGEESNPLSSLL